jgi:hypothetical protein
MEIAVTLVRRVNRKSVIGQRVSIPRSRCNRSNVIARSGLQRSNPDFACREMDCFAGAHNDGAAIEEFYRSTGLRGEPNFLNAIKLFLPVQPYR